MDHALRHSEVQSNHAVDDAVTLAMGSGIPSRRNALGGDEGVLGVRGGTGITAGDQGRAKYIRRYFAYAIFDEPVVRSLC